MKDDFDVSKLLTKKVKRINSKAKGGRFERKIADILNERFKTKDFCRTPGSGAFATTHNLPEHLKIYGDLITPKDFNFIFELKSGYNKEGISNIFNENSILRKMIAQVERDSEKSLKKFILVIGQDRQDIVILTNAIIPTNFSFNNDFGIISIGAKAYTLMKFSDLLKHQDNFFYPIN